MYDLDKIDDETAPLKSDGDTMENWINAELTPPILSIEDNIASRVVMYVARVRINPSWPVDGGLFGDA